MKVTQLILLLIIFPTVQPTLKADFSLLKYIIVKANKLKLKNPIQIALIKSRGKYRHIYARFYITSSQYFYTKFTQLNLLLIIFPTIQTTSKSDSPLLRYIRKNEQVEIRKLNTLRQTAIAGARGVPIKPL
jgi:hypothetical protein